MSIESVVLSNHLILCHPLLLLPSVFPTIRVFSNESALPLQVAKVLELQHQSLKWIFKVEFLYARLVWSPCSLRDSQEFSPAPQFERIDSSARSLLYGPILTFIYDFWENHSFDYADFVSKVLSLLFNMLSRFVISFLPRSSHLLISWLQSL